LRLQKSIFIEPMGHRAAALQRACIGSSDRSKIKISLPFPHFAAASFRLCYYCVRNFVTYDRKFVLDFFQGLTMAIISSLQG
jgi:hypothetical protein